MDDTFMWLIRSPFVFFLFSLVPSFLFFFLTALGYVWFLNFPYLFIPSLVLHLCALIFSGILSVQFRFFLVFFNSISFSLILSNYSFFKYPLHECLSLAPF